MSKRNDINKILIIGAGPTIIGQGSELDYAGTQACRVLKKLGYKITVVNSNPAAVMTDTKLADSTYIMPLNMRSIEKIIKKENPDALIASIGGQSALNLCAELSKAGILKKYGVEVIGTTLDAIIKSEDRAEFKSLLTKLNIDSLKSDTAKTADEAVHIAERLGFPIVVRPAFTMGGEGGGLVYNREELRTVAARGIAASLTGQILVEEAVVGWKELELEVIRDAKNNTITVCAIENIDAMGIHTGDSLCVVPMLTVSQGVQNRMNEIAYKIVNELGITGSVNLQFAYNKNTDRIAVIEINPRASRTLTVAAKVSGLPVAKISAMLAVGITLDEIPYCNGETLNNYKPKTNSITVKMPRWDFEKLKGSVDLLGTQMKSTGEVIGIGKTYKEALQKAAQSLDNDACGLSLNEFDTKTVEELITMLKNPTSKRQNILYTALLKGTDTKQLSSITGIDIYFINQMKELALLENEIGYYKGGRLQEKLLAQAKKDGFSDKYLAKIMGSDEPAICNQRECSNIKADVQALNISGEGDSQSYYLTYNAENTSAKADDKQKIIILGSGATRIGQGTEFDCNCVNAAEAFKKHGYEVIIVNCAPDSVSTENDVADRLYIEPLNVENILNIYKAEKPIGVAAQFGGQTAVKLAAELEKAGVNIIDKYVIQKDILNTANKLNIPVTQAVSAKSADEALNAAKKIGLPITAKYKTPDGIREAKIIYSEQQLTGSLQNISNENQIIIGKFLAHATEAEADAVSNGEEVFIPAIIEHIELAGIHSGDSASVMPSVNIAQKHIDTIHQYCKQIAKEHGICGLFNVQFAIANDTVYLTEANLYASRTVPLAAKVCNSNLAKAAAEVIISSITGKSFDISSMKPKKITHYGVKEAVLPFNMFPEVDPALSPEMRSTGEVLGLADSFGLAFFRAQEATQTNIPLAGRVLISVNNEDKHEALIAANAFSQMGFEILATSGTQQWLKQNGVRSTHIYKLNEGRPNILDEIINGRIDIIINTPATTQGLNDDSYIRKAAIKNKVFYMTTMAAAIAAVKGVNAIRGTTHFIAKSLQEYHSDIK